MISLFLTGNIPLQYLKEWILILFFNFFDRIYRIILFIFGFRIKPKIPNPLSAEMEDIFPYDVEIVTVV